MYPDFLQSFKRFFQFKAYFMETNISHFSPFKHPKNFSSSHVDISSSSSGSQESYMQNKNEWKRFRKYPFITEANDNFNNFMLLLLN